MMKQKWLACAAMACVLAASAAAPAMAAEAPAAVQSESSAQKLPQIVPYSSIGQDSSVNSKGTYVSSTATGNRGEGKYIRFYFKNTGKNTCTVTLEKKELLSWSQVSSFQVSAGNQKQAVYQDDTETGKYRLRIEASDGGNITGSYNIAQYTTKPA